MNSIIKQRNKNVLNANAQIGTVCVVDNAIKQEIEILNISLANMKIRYKLEYYCCVFMLETGCRISETLKIKHSDIDSLGRVYIRASKKSNDRIVTSVRCAEFLIKCRELKTDVFSRLNRYHIYRICKKFGIEAKYLNNKNKSVTHYFRHINAILSQNLSKQKEVTKQTLGHKTQKSTEYYLKERIQ